MYSPWGQTDRITELLPGVFDVSTPSHGGFMIKESVAREHLSDACIARGERFGSMICFEEDCAYALPCYEWAELLDKLNEQILVEPLSREETRKTIEYWYAGYLDPTKQDWQVENAQRND